MAGELSPREDGLPIVADAATRDVRFPLATRSQNQRVYRLDSSTTEMWSGSAWLVVPTAAASVAAGTFGAGQYTMPGALTLSAADTQGGFLWVGCTGPLVGTESHGARIAHTSGGTGAGRGMQITNVYSGTYASTGIDVQGYTTGTTAQDHLAVVQSFGYVQSAASPGIVYAYYGGGENQGSGTVANAYGYYHAGFTNTGSGAISNKWAFFAAADMSSFAGLRITGGTSSPGSLVSDAVLGLCLRATTGSSFDYGVFGPAGATILQVPTGTVNVVLSGSVKIGGGTSGDATINKDATLGLCVRGIAGATNDLGFFGPGGTTIMTVPTGTVNATFAGIVSAAGVTITTSASIAGRISKDATNGIVVRGVAGSSFDLAFFNAAGSTIATVATATVDVAFASTKLHTSSVALTNGAAAAAGTLANAPTAGNPTKWVPINDNGTTRYIPAW